MSRAYRIALSDTLRRHVEIEDGIQSQLELIPVLAADRMRAILAEELNKKGFAIDGDRARREETDGIMIEINLQESTVNIVKKTEKDISLRHQIERTVEEERKSVAEKQMKKQLKEELEEQLQQQQEEARKQLTQELKGRLGDIQLELDQIINTTISQSLKEKAAAMGEIEEINEHEDGSISIRINL